jgi:hypothetical protein
MHSNIHVKKMCQAMQRHVVVKKAHRGRLHQRVVVNSDCSDNFNQYVQHVLKAYRYLPSPLLLYLFSSIALNCFLAALPNAGIRCGHTSMQKTVMLAIINT